MQVGIRSKLKLISLLPILLLLGFASYFLYQSTTNYIKGQTFNEKMAYSTIVNDLATQLAKERGMTSIYIASNGKKIKDSLGNQRKAVDKQVEIFKQYLTLHPEIKAKKLVTMLLGLLNQKRQQIDALQIDFDQAFFKYYSVLIKALLDEIDQVTALGPDNEITNEAKAFISFAKAKEASGIERGFMSYILTRYTKMSDEELRKWIHYIGQADTFEFGFINDMELKQRIKTILENEDSKEIFDELAQARTEILHSINDGYYTIDPTLWFNLNTEKISILVNAQKVIMKEMNNKAAETLQEQMYIAVASGALWIISIILAIIGFIVSREITQNIKNLETILQNVAESTNQKMDINLDTPEGTAKAYALLQAIIEETRREQQRAEEASEAKSLFLANMSHEIRTPLNGIVGFTELLKNTELKGEQKEFVSIIEKSSENLLEIINNILDLSKIESNKVEIENIVFNPIEEFESAIEIYAVKAAEKHVNLACFIDPRLNQPIKGDPTKIKEILINLMSNAVKFTNQGGSINVEVRKVHASEPDRCAISFSVEDTGIGISPDKKAHIFEAFSQADTSVTRKFGGTGLGLTISARYAELMGGKLDLESELGKGTRFFFTLEFEELPQMNEDLRDQFTEVLVAFFTSPSQSKKQDEYIKEYMDYFGAKLIPFGTPEELIKLATEKKTQSALIDADYASDNDLRKMGKTPLHCNVIIKSTQQKRIEALKLHCEKIIYEPVNVTKIISLLKAATSEVVKEVRRPLLDIDHIGFNAKALVAEDNTINQKLIKRTLEDLGLTVELADNGLEAFEKRRSGDYDIIFMDISMPVMDGVESTHEILDYEEDENIPHIPIVALTANALKGDRERFLAEGLDEYTTKPLIREEIVSILKKFLGDKMFTKEAAAQTASPSAQKAEKAAAAATSGEVAVSFDEVSEETEPAKETEKPKSNADTILVLKKSPLEGKIFANLLHQLGYKVDVAENPKELADKLNENVAVVFVDKETESLALEPLQGEIKMSAPQAALILMTDPSTKVDEKERKLCDEVIINLVNRDLIRLIIEKFMKNEG
ncbi:nitrate- and nitrite sensing domain-containing protein [Hydrogenimonas sp.]|uniref:nitrate- and nitrite sensing domain-containing protein n=1 Tax=Hydrogenimonas sp. TaxID=2231112 RepID=UPI002617B6DB|nr:nitrate- and nitrite sensing domain-containing protein [Hydrogenimonas sp.]